MHDDDDDDDGGPSSSPATTSPRVTMTTLADLQKLTPLLHRTESGRVGELEKFSHYIARQLGFEDGTEVPELCKLANAYLTKTKGCDESIYEYFADEKDADSLYVQLVDEFERYILSYFSFHWNHASSIITLVLRIESEHKSKLREFLLTATRQQRFETVTKNLKVTRVFSTLVKEMKTINMDSESTTYVMVPTALSERCMHVCMHACVHVNQHSVSCDSMQAMKKESRTNTNAEERSGSGQSLRQIKTEKPVATEEEKTEKQEAAAFGITEAPRF